jgi:rhodanese-related sulfurtransferase
MAKVGARELVRRANREIETVTVAQALELAGREDVVFVDVREAGERARGTIPGSVHAPRGSLEFYADPESPLHLEALSSGKQLVLFCSVGGRSALAAKTLRDMGIERAANLEGGFGAWAEAGGRVER